MMWDWFAKTATLLGFISLIPIFWTWYEIAWGSKRRYKAWFEAVRQTPGRRPGVLIVDLLPAKEMRAQVENFLKGSPDLKAIPAERILSVNHLKRTKAEDLPSLVLEVRQQIALLMRQGVDAIHLFYGGPCAVAAIIGAELRNGCRVQLYNHEQGTYVTFGPLLHLEG
jgi:hypothetical protein